MARRPKRPLLENRPKATKSPAQRARISASVAAYWAAKRGEETPEQRAARDATNAYQRAWRAAQSPEWHAARSARKAEYRARKKASE